MPASVPKHRSTSWKVYEALLQLVDVQGKGSIEPGNVLELADVLAHSSEYQRCP